MSIAIGSAGATRIGLAAIVLWSAMVGLIRLVSESFGPTLGAALLYTAAAALLWAVRRPRQLRRFPIRYAVIGGGLFVLYEVAVGLSIGLAGTAEQAIQVSIVNYLWPTLTVLLTVLVHRGRGVTWLIAPGVVSATLGVVLVVSGDAGFDLAGVARSVAVNALPYLLALVGALAWALYTVLTPRLAGGRDGVTLFFTGVAVALWVVHALAPEPAVNHLTVPGGLALAVAAIVIAAGYVCWNIGILRGDLALLASASYVTPVLSAVIAAALLGTALSVPFWLGVVLVAIGSVLSWAATRRLAPRPH